MAFAQSCPVRSKDHGDMSILGHGFMECFVNEDLTGCIIDVVIPPDYMGDSHADVIHHHGQMISGAAFGSLQDEIVELLIIKGYGPFYEIFENSFSGPG